MDTLTDQQVADFHADGYINIHGLVDQGLIDRILQLTDHAVAQEIEPVEYEAALGYHGAPPSFDAPGGRTIRRILQIIGRDPAFTALAVHPGILARLRSLLGPELVLPLAHHNCVMVKDPKYSSATGWHRDIRYWRFQRPELVTALLALNHATETNGCLMFIPGSHTMMPDPEQLDSEEFLRADLPRNQQLLDRAIPIVMAPGDVVLFHCRTFHAAGRNLGGEARKSVLFTYRSATNPPLPGSRSASMPELLLHPPPMSSTT